METGTTSPAAVPSIDGTPQAGVDGAVVANAAPTESPTNGHAAHTPDIDPARLDFDAVRVVLRLRQHGYEAYLVGGCVRDLLVGRTPKDFDIATSAHPDDVRDLFRNCRLIGRRFRLAHVYFKGGKILEVSTFRASPTDGDAPQPSEAAEGDVRTLETADMAAQDVEGSAEAARDAVAASLLDGHPEAPDELAGEPMLVDGADIVEVGAEGPITGELTVSGLTELPAGLTPPTGTATLDGRDHFISEDNIFGTAIQDARRRDFTINGLFYDPAEGRVIDHVKGSRDLRLRQIRTIGDPEVRMREDPVRLLRAVRFACKLGFDIEPWTYAAMEGAVEDLPRCSAPRLLEETFRLIRGGVASPALRLLQALDALKVLLKPLDEYLRRQDKESLDDYFAFADALDQLVSGGAQFEDSMLLAALLLPLSLENPNAEDDKAGRPMVAQAIEALLAELVRTARLPRRIAERCRMMLLAMPTLAGLRRRRGGLDSFRRHPLFNEALLVFEVWVKATGEHEEALATWHAGGAPEPSADAPSLGGRKRRRRRRRGGGGGGNGAQSGGGDAPASGGSSDGGDAAS